MRTRFRDLLAAGATAAILGAPAAANAPPAAADPPICTQPAPGVTRCTSPGHGEVNVSPPVELSPGYQHGGYGGPYFVPYWS